MIHRWQLACWIGVILTPVMAWSQSPSPKDVPADPLAPTQELTQILGKSLHEWLYQIRDADPSIRKTAIRMVVLFGEKAKPEAIPMLIKAVGDRDTSCQVAAMMSLAELGVSEDSQKVELVRLLRRLLIDSEGAVRFRAAMTLASLGQDARGAIHELANKTMRDASSWEIRHAAALALGNIGRPKGSEGPDSRAVISLAVYGLRDRSQEVRQQTLRSLMILGRPNNPKDAEALRSMLLKHAVRDPNSAVAIWSRICLMRLAPEQMESPNLEKHVKAFQGYLQGSDLEAAVQASQAVATMGVEAKPFVADLVNLLQHDDLYVMVAAMSALGQMGTLGDPLAVPRLQELTDHSEDGIRRLARQVLAVVTGQSRSLDDAKMP